MPSIKVLLAGESWSSTTTHVKGFDGFFSTDFQTGTAGLKRALEGSDFALTHMPGHDVATQFPSSVEELSAFDVVVLSDIGANTLLLHPDTFLRGQCTPNRLKAIADWVAAGGGFLMAGGYYSFQGIYGAAAYKHTAIEAILPVSIEAGDDRVEVPEGFVPTIVASHPVVDGIEPTWPYLLGYNRTVLKQGAQLIATAETGDVLLAAGTYGKGRTLAWTSDISPHWLPHAFMDWAGYAQRGGRPSDGWPMKSERCRLANYSFKAVPVRARNRHDRLGPGAAWPGNQRDDQKLRKTV